MHYIFSRKIFLILLPYIICYLKSHFSSLFGIYSELLPPLAVFFFLSLPLIFDLTQLLTCPPFFLLFYYIANCFFSYVFYYLTVLSTFYLKDSPCSVLPLPVFSFRFYLRYWVQISYKFDGNKTLELESTDGVATSLGRSLWPASRSWYIRNLVINIRVKLSARQ